MARKLWRRHRARGELRPPAAHQAAGAAWSKGPHCNASQCSCQREAHMLPAPIPPPLRSRRRHLLCLPTASPAGRASSGVQGLEHKALVCGWRGANVDNVARVQNLVGQLRGMQNWFAGQAFHIGLIAILAGGAALSACAEPTSVAVDAPAWHPCPPRRSLRCLLPHRSEIRHTRDQSTLRPRRPPSMPLTSSA